jgi:hypothetical protein
MHLVHNSPPDTGAAVACIAAARAERIAVQDQAEPTWPMHTIARKLGVNRRSPRWQRDYIAALIANEGFPAPLPTMINKAISRDISPAHSRWIPAAVAAWLGGTLPPGTLAALESAEAREAADRLDARAADLFGGAA